VSKRRDTEPTESPLDHPMLPFPSGLPRPPAVDHPWCDSSEAPLYWTRWPAVTTVGEIDAYMGAIEDWAGKVETPWASVLDFDAFDAGQSSAAKRQAFVRGAQRARASIARHCVGLGLVVSSPLARGAILAVQWFIEVPDFRTYASCAEARRVLEETLRDVARG
jgi:hypothetical protein